jgi:hypothetical protein
MTLPIAAAATAAGAAAAGAAVIVVAVAAGSGVTLSSSVSVSSVSVSDVTGGVPLSPTSVHSCRVYSVVYAVVIHAYNTLDVHNVILLIEHECWCAVLAVCTIILFNATDVLQVQHTKHD